MQQHEIVLRAPRGHRARRIVAAAAATALIGAFGAVAVPVVASAATIDANTIVIGGVQANSLVARGATVTVEIWPNSTIADAVPDGGTLPTITLGPVTVSADGSFALDANPATVTADYRDPDTGTVDMEVDVQWNGSVTFWDTSVLPGTAGAAWTSIYDTGAPPFLLFGLGVDPGVYEAGNDPSQSVDESGNVVGGTDIMSTASVTVPNGITPCHSIWQATNTFTTGKDHVIDAYGWSGAHVTEDQEIGSGYTLGVAVSGNDGFFKAEGGVTRSISSSIRQSITVTQAISSTYSEAFYDKVNYRKWQKTQFCENSIKVVSTEWRPDGHDTVAVPLDMDPGYSHPIPHPRNVFAVPPSQCTNQPATAKPSTHTSKAVKFSAGITLTGVLKKAGVSVTLSTENDYSVNATESWSVTKPSSLCYTSSRGESASTRLEVEAPVNG